MASGARTVTTSEANYVDGDDDDDADDSDDANYQTTNLFGSLRSLWELRSWLQPAEVEPSTRSTETNPEA